MLDKKSEAFFVRHLKQKPDLYKKCKIFETKKA